jgi:hypothetical protein
MRMSPGLDGLGLLMKGGGVGALGDDFVESPPLGLDGYTADGERVSGGSSLDPLRPVNPVSGFRPLMRSSGDSAMVFLLFVPMHGAVGILLL